MTASLTDGRMDPAEGQALFKRYENAFWMYFKPFFVEFATSVNTLLAYDFISEEFEESFSIEKQIKVVNQILGGLNQNSSPETVLLFLDENIDHICSRNSFLSDCDNHSKSILKLKDLQKLIRSKIKNKNN